MTPEEKQEHIRLLKKMYSNTFWPLTGSKYFYFNNVNIAKEITKETVVYGMV